MSKSDDSKKKVTGRVREKRNRPPANSPEIREQQLVALAMDLAEKQLRDGTATSQVMTHFLKVGSETERLAREKLRNENKLLLARVDDLESRNRIEELYAKALLAMSRYSGDFDPHQELEDDIDYE